MFYKTAALWNFRKIDRKTLTACNFLRKETTAQVFSEAVVQRCSVNGVLKNFTKFTGKHLGPSLFLMYFFNVLMYFFPVFGLNAEIYGIRIQEKIRTRENSVFGHFSRNVRWGLLNAAFSKNNCVYSVYRIYQIFKKTSTRLNWCLLA